MFGAKKTQSPNLGQAEGHPRRMLLVFKLREGLAWIIEDESTLKEGCSNGRSLRKQGIPLLSSTQTHPKKTDAQNRDT